DVSNLNFGAFQTIRLSGQLFRDADGDGARGAGEAGLAGRVVYLDANNNGVLDSGEQTAATDSSGAYSFANLGPGSYRVRDVLPAGWTQTTADPADVTASSGVNASGVDFGAFQNINLSGQVFE